MAEIDRVYQNPFFQKIVGDFRGPGGTSSVPPDFLAGANPAGAPMPQFQAPPEMGPQQYPGAPPFGSLTSRSFPVRPRLRFSP